MTGPADPPAGWESYEAAVAGCPADPVADESLGAAMLYSSGTTGQPKGILRALPDVEPSEPLPVMDFVRAMFGFRPGMTYLNPAPLYHSAPQASVSASLRLGATTRGDGALRRRAVACAGRAVPGDPLPDGAGRCSAGCSGCPTTSGPATTPRRWSASCTPPRRVPCTVKQAMIDWLGPIITEYYGATEANGFTFCDSRAVASASRHGRPADPR